MAIELYGYRYSVYTRIARMILAVKGVDSQMVEVNPFAEPSDPILERVTPFHRVPVLDHDGFVLFETSAITRYVAARFAGPQLVPEDAKSAARMEQVIAIVDAHGYWPLVRQVFSHGVFRPLLGEPVDPGQISRGLIAAKPVLVALEDIASEGRVLTPGQLTLADLHLAPMIGYFVLADKGCEMLALHPGLGNWWREMSRHPAYVASDPGLATPAAGG